uniref:DUF4432 family protein n=1 Tax=Pararhizobium sp. IMCC3301 TaxID=3067904 RepID=UPI002742390C|nr:DUF4432 family protein [Pararhizobium sp. IMCC3301]
MSQDSSLQSPPDIAALRRFYPDLAGYGDIRLVTLGDGAERGVRVLEIRSGGGLELEVIVDRGFDLGRLALNGITVSWHCQNGYRAPWLLNPFSDKGQGFLRANNGFLSTCGFDHIRQPETDALDDRSSFPNEAFDYPLHGSGAHQPARLISYGFEEDADIPYFWCEGEIVQTMQFHGSLRLRRRLEVPIGGQQISMRDRVVNSGPTVMSHMMLYHFNIGHPLVAEATEIDVCNGRQIWGQGDPLSAFPAPQSEQHNSLSVFAMDSEAENGLCTISNPHNGLQLELEFERQSLPFLQLLRMTGQGTYGIGIEPCTTGQRSRSDARTASEMVFLKPGDHRTYNFNIRLNATQPGRSGTVS